MDFRKRNIWITAFCVYLAAVLYLCFMKPDSLPELRPDLWGIPLDKLAHFLMFFPFPLLSYIAFRPRQGGKWRSVAVLAVLYITGIGFAFGTEQLQGLSEYRSNDPYDFLADIIGMTASAIFTFGLILIMKNRKN